jgi:hypothetical protein
MTLVGAECPLVPPAGVLACHGDLAPHASQRKGSRIGIAPRGSDCILVEMESARANELLVVRGGHLSEKLSLVGNLSEKHTTSWELETRHCFAVPSFERPASQQQKYKITRA